MSKSVVEPVRIELPFPPRELSPNDRSGWRVKAREAAKYREDCGWAAVAAFGPGRLRKPRVAPPVTASVTFVVPDRRRRDLDNLLAMLKPAWDGLTDAGVLAGDNASQFKVGSASIAVLEHAKDCRWRTIYRARCSCSAAPCVIVSLSGAGTTQ